jgi:hypothetical protein
VRHCADHRGAIVDIAIEPRLHRVERRGRLGDLAGPFELERRRARIAPEPLGGGGEGADRLGEAVRQRPGEGRDRERRDEQPGQHEPAPRLESLNRLDADPFAVGLAHAARKSPMTITLRATVGLTGAGRGTAARWNTRSRWRKGVGKLIRTDVGRDAERRRQRRLDPLAARVPRRLRHARDAIDLQFAPGIAPLGHRMDDLADGVELRRRSLGGDQQREVHQLDHRDADQHQQEDAQEQRRSGRAPG